METGLTNIRLDTFRQLKQLMLQRLASRELTQVVRVSKERLRIDLGRWLADLTVREGISLDEDDRVLLVDEIVDEIHGFGPLEPLMRDPEITDILVNGSKKIYVERRGILYRADVEFENDDVLLEYIRRIAARTNRRIDETNPMVDVRLEDGSRLNAIIPPLARFGPTLSVRRFGGHKMTIDDLVERHALSQEIADFLAQAVEARASIMFSGGTGAGKTTLLNCLSAFIPHRERVITIEQTGEIQLQQPDVVALEARTKNIEGRGEVTIHDLVKNSLRMRPDRIIVGECRGGEVFDVLQAMLTGHDGSMSTIHASNTRDALHRMELMCALAGVELPKLAVRQYIASAVDLIVQLRRLSTGERKVVSVTEIEGLHDGEFSLRDVFEYRQDGIDKFGRSIGGFFAVGHVPQRTLARMRELGRTIEESRFQPRRLETSANPRQAGSESTGDGYGMA